MFVYLDLLNRACRMPPPPPPPTIQGNFTWTLFNTPDNYNPYAFTLTLAPGLFWNPTQSDFTVNGTTNTLTTSCTTTADATICIFSGLNSPETYNIALVASPTVAATITTLDGSHQVAASPVDGMLIQVGFVFHRYHGSNE